MKRFKKIMLLATPILLALAACDDSSSPLGDTGSLSSAGEQNNLSSSSAEGDGPVCGFSKADNVWKYSYWWFYVDIYTWVDETTVEFKEYFNNNHKDKNDTTFTNVNRDELYEEVLSLCQMRNDVVMESSSAVAVECKTETEDNCEYGILVDDRDGQTYKTVKIGDQWWMAENLNYADSNSSCYNDSLKYCEKYGRLYGQYTAREMCPEGWRLPEGDEWLVLNNMATETTKIKSRTGWLDGKNGVDAFGFSALPAGFMEHGSFNRVGYETRFHEAENKNCGDNCPSFVYPLFVHIDDFMSAHYITDYEAYLYSVRCVKDTD